MRILFWGTPDFAAPALRALLGEGFDVVGVVTQPDRAQGRSRSSLVPPPVKTIALEDGVPVFQPEQPRGAGFLDELRALEPDVSVVVAYGRLLSQEVIGLPRLGTLNIHASLLPRWRGAAPIQAAILSGDGETGISVMRLVLALDAGPVLLRAPIPIADDETYGELLLRLSELGALSIVEALALLDVGAASETVQDEAAVTYAPKITREMARIDWHGESDRVARVVRAFDPRPGAFTALRGADVKLFGARVTEPGATSAGSRAGEVLAVGDSGIVVACGRGAVRISDVQPAGKRRIAAGEWVRGRGVQTGELFGE